MPRFRKKPVEVEAMLWDGSYESQGKIVTWADGKVSGWFDGEYFLAIVTLEGEMRANIGDWIIKGVAGEFYPCKPEIFEATYEPVERPLEEIQAEMVEKALRWQFAYAGLDPNDPDNKQAFLDALREHGIPCGG